MIPDYTAYSALKSDTRVNEEPLYFQLI